MLHKPILESLQTVSVGLAAWRTLFTLIQHLVEDVVENHLVLVVREKSWFRRNKPNKRL